MKILWFCNIILSKSDSGASGSWLYALANALNSTDQLQLGNITCGGNTNNINYNKFDNIQQWQIPNKSRRRNGLPNSKSELAIIKIIREFNPDLIHVWGVEHYWGAITKKIKNEFPVLLEIQGLLKDIAPVYGGELTYIEKLKCIGIKEFVTLTTIFNQSKKYRKWGEIETDIIRSHTLFSTHSQWAEAKVKELNPECIMFKNERLLRNDFYTTKGWKPSNLPIIFTSVGYPAPFKGLLTLIRAIEIIKYKYPDILIYIAGSFQFEGIRRNGYMHFLLKYIQKRKLENNITFIGQLNGNKIVNFLQKTAVAVLPSYVESYGLVMAECMAVGTPVVAAYNGGYSYLGRDNEDVLFFAPGDAAMCAFQIDKIISDKDLASFLSTNARKKCLERNDPNKVLNNQISIYKDIINDYHITKQYKDFQSQQNLIAQKSIEKKL